MLLLFSIFFIIELFFKVPASPTPPEPNSESIVLFKSLNVFVQLFEDEVEKTEKPAEEETEENEEANNENASVKSQIELDNENPDDGDDEEEQENEEEDQHELELENLNENNEDFIIEETTQNMEIKEPEGVESQE